MEWQSQGSCKGKPLEWFFFKNTKTEIVFPQVADLCAKCPVRFDCFHYAINTVGLVGIWAGTTTADRMKLRRENRQRGCGTVSGYHGHRYRSEPVCDKCKAAMRDYQANRRGGYVFRQRAN
jgi:WhiB family redox-sensing transcriptional regulator